MVPLGNQPRSFCRFWDCTQVLHLGLFCWLYDGYSISSKGFLPAVVDMMVTYTPMVTLHKTVLMVSVDPDDHSYHSSCYRCLPSPNPAVPDFWSWVEDLGEKYKSQAGGRGAVVSGRLPFWEGRLRKTWRLCASSPDKVGGREIKRMRVQSEKGLEG